MQNYADFIENLKTLISFKTTFSPKKENAPFGEENAKALAFFLDLAKSFGFETINYDNYAGEVFFGEGEEIGIVGHLDVVPIGMGWETDPFLLTEKDGFLYARGVMDDKTPTLMALYILKELKDSCIKPNKKFRLFIGCNEETGWQDIEYLKSKTNMPEYGFSPDGNFPLSYAEKGMTNAFFKLPLLNNFYDIKGGTVINAVCDYACATAKSSGINVELLKKHGLSLKDGNVIESFGVSAHSSAPHLGKNALKPLFEYFADMGENVQNVLDCLFYDKFGVGRMKNEQGVLTMSPDLIEEKDGKIIIGVNFRIPAPLTTKDLISVINKFGFMYDINEKHPPMMVEKDGWFVQTLLGAYNAVTGESATPISMGGSTFARAFKKGCAFGMDFCHYDSSIHNANEKVSKQDLISAYEIYKKAIFDLAQL